MRPMITRTIDSSISVNPVLHRCIKALPMLLGANLQYNGNCIVYISR
jgi:hypothetical protein